MVAQLREALTTSSSRDRVSRKRTIHRFRWRALPVVAILTATLLSTMARVRREVPQMMTFDPRSLIAPLR